MFLATRSFATMSLATIVLCDKFYNKLKHKKPRIIIKVKDLHCLLGLVFMLILSGITMRGTLFSGKISFSFWVTCC